MSSSNAYRGQEYENPEPRQDHFSDQLAEPDEESWPEDQESSAEESGDEAATRVQVRVEELRARLLTAKGLRNIPAPEPLVDGWLFLNSIAWLAGKPGHAKTFVAVEF